MSDDSLKGKKMSKEKMIFSILGGFVTAFARQYALILLFTVIVVVMDFITGIIGAKAQGEKITSKKGYQGFWKKMALFTALCFGFFLDYFIPYCVGQIGITLPDGCAIFGMTIGCYIVINEAISISENIYKANPSILPKWITKMLESAKDQIDKKEEKK